MAKYEDIEGGGSLILAWQVRNKKVLVVGGGEVSTEKAHDQNNKKKILTLTIKSRSQQAV